VLVSSSSSQLERSTGAARGSRMVSTSPRQVRARPRPALTCLCCLSRNHLDDRWATISYGAHWPEGEGYNGWRGWINESSSRPYLLCCGITRRVKPRIKFLPAHSRPALQSLCQSCPHSLPAALCKLQQPRLFHIWPRSANCSAREP
jgi:hypothetical protein